MPADTDFPTFETIATERPEAHVLTVRLNRPDVANAFNTRMAQEILLVLDSLPNDTETRCVVLTGTGERAFCAGADLKERDGMSAEDWAAQHALFERMAHMLMDSPVPVIAAINGAAYAGGFELVLACDFAYAATTARFALTEATLGLIPGIGGTQNLPRAAGLRRAKEILLTGRPFGAAEAEAWGIVNRLCEPEMLYETTLETARTIAGNAPLSVRQILKATDDGIHRSLHDALAIEVECYNTLVDTEDRHEGIRAFNEKRKPQFKGR